MPSSNTTPRGAFGRPVRITLQPFEAAFVLRRSESEIVQMLRRGQYAAETQGLAPDAILANGDLPVSWDGRLRRVSVEHLRQLIADDLLAQQFLDRILARRFRAPRAAGRRDKAPDPSLFVWSL